MKKTTLILLLLCCSLGLFAQRERIYRTFKDTRAVNVHSVETLPKGKLDVRISHRFGDMFGDNGGWPTFYGLETAEDVAIGAEYGFSDRFSAGIYRAKGAGATPLGQASLRQLLNGVFKYRALYQEEGGTPISIAVVGTTSLSTSTKIEGNDNLIRSFPKFAHRMAFNGSLVVARKFGPSLSLQLIPGVTHRNLVPFEGENTIFSLGGAARFQVSKVFALVGDVTMPFSNTVTSENGYSLPLGVGFEWDTGGHVFQLNFTNATGIFETDYIPYTTSSWGEGEFRIGFTISRWFNL
ncbi:DUF5777 family beta-barrel protein [Neolewinella lacunae]|uniref:DUF5777 domain-containing protein n=1 Tax=Neolewinella lacunae TaxID=1517758 RepID=A0A923T9Q4_9BACT|nr:DUF5777 family beta-barrel protein [Neolewinella lacunae]MBC6995784.1 hypothetical protein [Neolewinella lacunae]MDN3636523.1 DUF5777 family beta-barrel protein [Neolewinella lacunae]